MANRRFYAEVLGVPVAGDHEKMAVFEGDLVIVAAHGNPPTTRAHLMLVADDLDSIADRLAGAGVTFRRAPSGTLSLCDPDSRMVEVMTVACDRTVASND